MNNYGFTKVLLRTVRIHLKASRWFNIIQMLMGAVHALTWTVNIWVTQILFDAITAAGNGGFYDCAGPLLLMAAVTFSMQIMNGVHNFFHGVVSGKATGHIRTVLQKKLQRIDPAMFEKTSFLDDLNKAREGAGVIPYFSMTIFNVLCFYGVYFLSAGAYLFSLKPLLLITLLLSFIPAMLSQIVRGKVFTKLEEVNAPLRREYEYYQKTLCDREYYKETRILGAFRFFHRLFDDTMMLFTCKIWQAERKTALLQLLLNLTTFAGMAAASYTLFTATMAGEITVGAFVAVFSALGNIFGIMQEIISSHFSNMNKDLGKVTNFIRMMDVPERTGVVGEADFTKGITAEHISFTYPGRDEPAIKDVSLTVADGETLAIVGENGAGKSTLVRLLTGIYRPSNGSVTVGGLDSAETAPMHIYKGISGVFQKYQRYKMTLRENVTISSAESETADALIETALKEADAGLAPKDGPVSFDTMLSPEFDGIDLSGGQWQRLAIARGLYRPSGFIVLDEPTSAIDPIEETKIYRQFQRLAKGKCAVVVTHRLGSAKLADRIAVMDSGQIADMGTHEELLSKPGKYADMWAAQAKWYERTEETV